ncbi:MAG: amidotransferase 1, exosortase system-associated [Alphaproteobacteria bacterium]|nr:amidotransferase 1, exosortase system-associated [Alphaproteobacteria bacterium]
MCGIAGIFHLDVPKPVDPERVGAMADTLAHRGPDGSGVWTAPGVGLGHRRLAIIDLEGGSQPMLSPDRRSVISFNGEIYNYREVRDELEGKGHRFLTAGDTETILAAYREWGPDCLSRFNGMFAFAIYDSKSDSLFLARDRLGVKPLFYAELGDGTLLFASELKALLVHPRFRPEISPQAVEDYLAYGYVPDDASILEGVRKLPAGTYLHLRRGHPLPKPVTWWDIDFSSRSTAKEADLQEELVERLRAAVRSRMVADVPLAAFLSGGVDSSAVVAFMAEASKQAIRTCSIGFDQADHDETRYAAVIAERFATDHRTRTVDADDFGLIDTLAGAFDEPFADASALATYRVCELARERVKVALTGDGADEAFAGYRRYRMFMAEEQVRGCLPQGLRAGIGRLGDACPKLDWAPRPLRAKTTLQAIGKDSGEAYAEAVGATPSSTRSMLYGEDFRRALQGHRAEDRYVKAMADAPASDPLSRAQYADLKIWLPGDILTKVDRTSMAVGLEAREPLLDHRLIEFAARLPPRLRLRRGQGKYLLKKSLEGRLPSDILYRPKQGFVTPVGEWLRGPLAAEAAAIPQGSALAGLGWFDPAVIARLADDHRRGRSDHGRLLWQLLMLERSLRRLTAPASPRHTEPRRNTVRLAAR